MNHFGERMKARRMELGLTTYSLSKQTGMDRGLISRLETGQRTATLQSMETLVPALQLPREVLLLWRMMDELGYTTLARIIEHFNEGTF